ncbi:MAG TPA: ABC transporter ATP-binding protein [Mesorhizobium sp.]|jgi:peptide/nickel transport system ATP-binding protein|uniref:ABC transporter ATP-binding protein n=1 Tax=Mesorhizobium sp. TaxID=1871066 RepID=UPI002DDD5243|nr:ABC transporter ATP-binding protein [Mesorhizobium sp.]HEV2502882.1 ABC transporter ATP-binding protein [Mesorhizobium sp.]
MMLSVRDLRVSFRTHEGLVRAIDGVSFELEEGEILGVVGESGSGKTVSLLAVMGLITDPNAVIEGSIRYKGRELVGLPARELRRLRGNEIAMIFQDPMTALTPVYTIGWQISEQIRAHKRVSKSQALARVEELLAEVNFPNPREAMSRFPHQLSGGMRQRAVIAMALSCNPALLVADEPTTALDVTVQAGILDLVRKLRATHNSAVVFITHDMGVVSELADRVMVMYAGRVVERGSRAELFSAPQHPYTRALLGSIPPLTGEKPHRLPAIPGSPPSLLRLPEGCAFGPRCPVNYEPCRTGKPDLGHGTHAAACFRVQA